MKPLFIPIKKEYFNAFKDGTKKHEFRLGSKWSKNNCVIGREVTLSKGYGTQERLSGVITSFEIVKVDSLSNDDACACRKLYFAKFCLMYGSNSQDWLINKIGITVNGCNTSN